MDKKWVAQTIVQFARDAKLVNWHEQEIEPDELAETIAAQHEREMTRARSEKTELLTCGHPAANADDDGCRMCRLVERTTVLELQLTTFKKLVGRFYGTLQVYSGGYQMRDPDHLEVLLADADHALKEAPEHNLIWRGQAYAYPGVIDELVVLPDGKMSVSEEMEGIDPPKNAQLISLYAVLKGSEEEDG